MIRVLIKRGAKRSLILVTTFENIEWCLANSHLPDFSTFHFKCYRCCLFTSVVWSLHLKESNTTIEILRLMASLWDKVSRKKCGESLWFITLPWDPTVIHWTSVSWSAKQYNVICFFCNVLQDLVMKPARQVRAVFYEIHSMKFLLVRGQCSAQIL